MALSANAFQSTTDGRDFYFLVLDPDWKSPRLATYFGGTGREHVDGGTSRFDRTGRIFQAVCAGCGGTSTYPTFPNNVYASSNGSSNCNLAVTVIDLDVQNARVSVQPDPPVFCLPNTFSILDSSINVQNFTVYWGDGNSTSGTSLQGGHIYASPGTYPVQVIGHDTICDTWDTATFTVQVNPAYDSVYTSYTYDFCDPLRGGYGPINACERLHIGNRSHFGLDHFGRNIYYPPGDHQPAFSGLQCHQPNHCGYGL